MSNYGMESVRLAGVDGDYRGRVEVLVAGEWGTICDDGWDVNDAQVVCRMLSLVGGEPVKSGWFGKGQGAVLVSQVDCQGNEFSIFDCDYEESNWCSHQQDAGVICDKPENVSISIRLTDGDNKTFGRVEIYHDNLWGTLCDSLWDDLDAIVACRMLGFKNGTMYKVPRNENQLGPGLMDFIDCVGYEDSLLDCPLVEWESQNCEDAGVRCS